MDSVFENINYYAVEASTQIAKEKGRYGLFEGSDWQTGAYFEKRGYHSERWNKLKETVAQKRHAKCLLNGCSTDQYHFYYCGYHCRLRPCDASLLLGRKRKTALYREWLPDLSMETFWYYKNAHTIDQTWTVKSCGVRQRHIDQAQSLNLYITNDYTFRQILQLYILAWEKQVKNHLLYSQQSIGSGRVRSMFILSMRRVKNKWQP